MEAAAVQELLKELLKLKCNKYFTPHYALLVLISHRSNICPGQGHSIPVPSAAHPQQTQRVHEVEYYALIVSERNMLGFLLFHYVYSALILPTRIHCVNAEWYVTF